MFPTQPWAQGLLDEGPDPGDVTGGVNATESGQEVQANRRCVDHFGNGVGANEARIHLRDIYLQQNVLRGQPDPLFLDIVWTFRAISLWFDVYLSKKQGRPGAPPHPLTAPNECQSRGNPDFIFLDREQWRLVAKAT